MLIILFNYDQDYEDYYISNEIKYHNIIKIFSGALKSVLCDNIITANIKYLVEKIIYETINYNVMFKTFDYSLKKFIKNNKNIEIYYNVLETSHFINCLFTIKIEIILERNIKYSIEFALYEEEIVKLDLLLNKIFNQYIIKYNKFDNKYNDIIIKTN